MKKLLMAIAVFSVVFISRDASALLSVEGRYWFTGLSGTANISGSGIPGTGVDLVKDLGLQSNTGFPEVRVGFNIGSNRIRYDFVPLKWGGTSTLSQTFNFNGQTFSASDRTSSELRANYHRLGFEHDFIDAAGERLGAIIEVKYFDMKAAVTDLTRGMEASKTLALPIPSVGVTGRVALPFLFGVDGEVSGISLGSAAYVIDGEAGMDFKPIPYFSLTGGYRALVLHFDHNDSKANMTVKGPFAGLKAEF